MHVAIDIDQTLTVHPKFYYNMMHAWLSAGYQVSILTGRMASERAVTLQLLRELGFGQIFAEFNFDGLIMYPEHYEWPFVNEEAERTIKQQHAAWKAQMCQEYGISVLYDDCEVNIAACRAVGVYAIHVPRMVGVVA